MNKSEVAAVLNEIGTIYDLLGENPFKVRAHHNAARVVETLGEDLAKLATSGELTKIKGIGKQIAAKIESLVKTGELSELAELRSKAPEGVFQILKIPGMGPKKVGAVWRELGVTTIGELEYACNENRLLDLDGFGAKSQENILRGIETIKKFADASLLPDALNQAEKALEHMLKQSFVIRAELAGSVRRAREIVKDVDIVASSSDPEAAMDHFTAMPGAVEVISKGKTKSSLRLESGIQVDIRVVADDQFPYVLHHFTGSREHNTAMRQLARSKGMKMNEYGLFREGKPTPCDSEKEIFEALGIGFIPPERRENIGEIEQALAGEPVSYVDVSDIAGVFHCHTNYSDGRETLKTMVNACIERGYGYLGVADHSRTASYAGGLSIDDLKRQSDEIDRLNKNLNGFHVFKGIESDILADGSLDYPEETLDRLDFVIASVHSGFISDEKKMTERLITAINNPYTTMLGHPTGRLLLGREGYPVNMDRIIEACAKNSVIIELNSNPHRLDIDWRHIGSARAAGVKISINPDAHRIPGLDHVKYGVMQARKGGCGKTDVFNTLPLDEVKMALTKLKPA